MSEDLTSHVMQIKETVGQISGKLDSAIAEGQSRESRVDKRLDRHSSRLTKVEHKQHWYAGAAAGIAVAATTAWDWFKTS